MRGLDDLARIARHELRLSWRDLSSMMRAGRRARVSAAIVAAVIVAGLHLVAWVTVRPYAEAAAAPDLRTLIVVSTAIVLSGCLFLSQAMESITRVLYGRGDLELILSSPASPRAVVAVRIATVGLSIGCMTLFTAGPFANVLALSGGPRWLGIYPAAFALGLAMTALALLGTIGLMRVAGPRRTRLAAQVVAAIIGALFAIALQIAAIVQYGQISRFAVVLSPSLLGHAPGADSPVWLPARAVMGDPGSCLAITALGLGGFAAILLLCLDRLVGAAFAASGATTASARLHRSRRLDVATPGGALTRKEWHLLARDPWLVSQTLMQILYLLPPAVMMWLSFGEGAGKLAILVPMIVMVSGQLAGSLAWLAISGEDAPDLVATAPVSRASVVRAKLAAVLSLVALLVVPFALALAWSEPLLGIVVVVAAAIAGGSAFLIQLWFQQPGRRSQFRRRQTASRIATFAEAFSSIGWAGTAALAIVSLPMALASGLLVLASLRGVKLLSPRAA